MQIPNIFNQIDKIYIEKTGMPYPVSVVGQSTAPEPTVEVAAPVIDIQLHCDPETGDCTVVGDITCETEGATIYWRYHSELEDLGETLTFQNTQYHDYEEYNIGGIEAEDYQAWFSGTGLVEAYAVLNGSNSETSSLELPIPTDEEPNEEQEQL